MHITPQEVRYFSRRGREHGDYYRCTIFDTVLRQQVGQRLCVVRPPVHPALRAHLPQTMTFGMHPCTPPIMNWAALVFDKCRDVRPSPALYVGAVRLQLLGCVDTPGVFLHHVAMPSV